MKLFSKFAIAAIAAAGSVVSAAEVINLNSKDFWRPMKNVTFSEGQMTNVSRAMYRSKKLFTIDPSKKYTFEMNIDSGKSDKKNTMFYIGFLPASEKGHMRHAVNYQNVPASFTEVIADVKKGDKVIKVKNASKWLNNNSTAIALDAKADFSDLPNTKIYNGGMISRVKKDDHWVITLKQPIQVDVAAGSFIRQHLNGGYFYIWYGPIYPEKNISINKSVTGKSKQGGFVRTAFHPALTHGFVIILSDWNNTKMPLTIKNAKLTIE